MKWVSQQLSVKAFCSSTDDALLRKAFTDILNCCDIHFTYILFIFICEEKKQKPGLVSLGFHEQVINC